MTTGTIALLHPCARCAQEQKTCCQKAEVFVTLGDVDRIALHLGQSDFIERRTPEDPAYLDADDDDPLWHRATVDANGQRRVLQRQANGDCTFLGEAGCKLPEDVRPLVCRLYPYDFTESGLAQEAAEYCPTSFLSAPGSSMAGLLGMRRDRAEAWRAQLYSELRSEVTAR